MALEFLNEIGEKARKAAVYASETAKAVAETAKINVQIANEQHNMDKNYKAIGEWFVAEYQGEYPEAIRDMVAAIAESKAKIAELQAAKETPEEEVVVEATIVEEVKKTCSNCGAVVDGKFCSCCGAPVGE